MEEEFAKIIAEINERIDEVDDLIQEAKESLRTSDYKIRIDALRPTKNDSDDHWNKFYDCINSLDTKINWSLLEYVWTESNIRCEYLNI